MCKIGPKATSVMSYYLTVVFDLSCESEYRFTRYPNPDSLIEYPLRGWSNVSAVVVVCRWCL